jgi:hypothetical protein
MKLSRLGTTLALLLLAGGCYDNRGSSPSLQKDSSESFDDALAKAHQANKPLAVLVIDPDRGSADRSAQKVFESALASRSDVASLVLDLRASRNRAAAAPLHALDVPTLICLSPKGIIVSRDEGFFTQALVREQIDRAIEISAQLDRRFSELQTKAVASPNDVKLQMDVADFLLAQHNDQLAIPYLKRVADDEQADLDNRIRAWVALGRAYLWDVEPEKARHCAQALIETLGPRSPEALAGGNLVRGLQDTKAKRWGRAREEFTAAVKAAPESAYGREAASLLAKLPTGK